MAQQVSVEGLISNNTSSVEGNMYIKESSSTESPWYHSEIGNRLKPPVRKVFEDYAKVQSVEVDNHISKIVSNIWIHTETGSSLPIALWPSNPEINSSSSKRPFPLSSLIKSTS